MNIEHFGNNKIYRPSVKSEINFRIEAEKRLRSKYSVGIYRDKDKINEILKDEFNYHREILERELPKIASRDLMEFVLYQFDEASQIEDKHKNYELSKAESTRWEELGPTFRRTIKYLAESIVILFPDEEPIASKDLLGELLDYCWISCEEMVKMYSISDQTFMVFPEKTILEIHHEGSSEYLTVKLSDEIDFREKVRMDTLNRTKILGDSKNFYQFRIDEHSKLLENSFTNAVGINYQTTIMLLHDIITHCDPAPNAFPILFVNKEKLIETAEKATSINRKIIEKVIDGFIISKAKMEREGRELFKPKQEYRAFRRAFFEMPHKTGLHLAFSKEMALECLFQLQVNVVFKQMPVEWLSESVKKDLEKIALENGKWFEKFVAEKLEDINYHGRTSISRMRCFNKTVSIPSQTGEIDYIGYSKSEHSILVVECKFVRPTFENTYFRDDLNDFVFRKKSYLQKFSNKVEWVRNNQSLVIEYLTNENIITNNDKPKKINTAIVTFYLNIADYFIDDYPCVSLSNLIYDYNKDNKWHYTKGVFNI